jgi:antitoxin component of RelBE/YafQ-DinJ toxin-antitoxin module
MPNQPKTPNFTFRLDPELVRKARRKAKLQGTNLAEVMRIRLEQYVYEDEWPFDGSEPVEPDDDAEADEEDK